MTEGAKGATEPAFPHTITTTEVVGTGITLRDYFGIHGPEPTIANVKAEMALNDKRPGSMKLSDDDIRAKLRYQMADSMIKMRSKG
jgi:hypothetical protein